MRNSKKRMLAGLLAAVLLLTGAAQAAQPSEAEAAGNYLVARGILLGDAFGDLKLNASLTRGELAAILTRLNGGAADVAARPDYYAGMCYFLDVPDWAKPYVGYCADSYLMNGYDLFRFGAGDAVNPAAACTVALRYLKCPESDWNYTTAVAKAAIMGITPAQGMDGGAITRGGMAIILYRAITKGENAAAGALSREIIPDGSGSVSNTPYTDKLLTGDSKSREDFSQQANPAIFDGIYTRAAYNAARQSIVDRDIILDGNNDKGFHPSYAYAYATASAETRSAMGQVVARYSQYHYYTTGMEPYLKNAYNYPDYFICKVQYLPAYTEAVVATIGIVAELREMDSTADRIRRINDIVCDKLTYQADASAMPNRVFATASVVQARCTGYAHAVAFLCDLAEIPCITVSSHNHDWNAVYVNGHWSYVDTVVNDVGDELVARNDALFVDSFPDPSHVDKYPQTTSFAKELLVPGSTK